VTGKVEWGKDWANLANDSYWWSADVLKTMNFRLLENKGNLLCSLRPAGFKIIFSIELVNPVCCRLRLYVCVGI